MRINHSYLLLLCALILFCIVPPDAVSYQVTYDYDHRGRLIRSDDGNGSVIEYSYDNVGNRTALSTTAAASDAPLAVTMPAEELSAGAATLTGRVAPNGSITSAWFEWGNTAELGNTTASHGLADTASTEKVDITVSNLSPGVTYYYRLVASSSIGTTHGETRQFTTPLSESADLQVTRTSVASPSRVGDHPYTITIKNNGPNAVSDVQLVEKLTGVAGIVSALPGSGTCDIDDASAVCNFGILVDGASASVDVIARSRQSGWVFSFAQVESASTDPVSENNFANASLQILSVDTDGDGIADEEDTDDDNDGMSDSWELANGLNPLDAGDADADLDGDGFSNREEFLAATNPDSADSIPISSSSTGWEWTNPLPTGERLSAVAYGNGATLAVGDNGPVIAHCNKMRGRTRDIVQPQPGCRAAFFRPFGAGLAV